MKFKEPKDKQVGYFNFFNVNTDFMGKHLVKIILKNTRGVYKNYIFIFEFKEAIITD